jgi:8-oxo-dGTP pyrophosphatase MutT (NUDIX family)
LFDPRGHILLLHASLATRPDFWVCPGGGVEPGETWEQAARREAMEETGLPITLGPLVWYRQHVYSDSGRDYNLYERYFVAHTHSTEVRPAKPDSYISGHRWWSLDDLLTSNAEFTPRRFRELIPPIAREDYPKVPFDCGI